MPTSKPRFSVTLDPVDLAILDRFSMASGQPRASIVAQLIKASGPELLRASEIMEMAQEAPRKVLESLSDDLSAATSAAMGRIDAARSEFHALMGQLKLELDAPTREAVPRRGAPSSRRRGGPRTPTY